MNKVASKQDILMDSLILFYQNEEYTKELLNIVDNSNTISLRINYQKANTKKEKKKRRELSQSASKTMNKYSMPVTVNFN